MDAKELTKKLLGGVYPYTLVSTVGKQTSSHVPHKGDIVCFKRNGDFQHTGIVVYVADGVYNTIEGNTSGASGVVSNGGGVCKKSYAISSIGQTVFFSPNYQLLVDNKIFASTSAAIEAVVSTARNEIGYLEKKSNSGLDSKTQNAGYNNYTKYWRDIYPSFNGQSWCACFVNWVLQMAIEDGNSDIDVDGYWGSDTTTALQQIFGTVVDGKVSAQLARYKSYYPTASTFVWVCGDSSSGSSLIRAMEKKLKAAGFYTGKIDGLAGPGFALALKLFLADQKLYTGETSSSVFDSACTKALQKWINEEKT